MKSKSTLKFKAMSKSLTDESKHAKMLVEFICKMLSDVGNRKFYVEMNCVNDIYEGHIIDTGKIMQVDPSKAEEYEIEDENEEIGMIFFGGFFNRKEEKDAESKAWISLLYDIIGQSEDVEIRSIHNLTDSLKDFGPKIDFNFDTVHELEEFLKIKGYLK